MGHKKAHHDYITQAWIVFIQNEKLFFGNFEYIEVFCMHPFYRVKESWSQTRNLSPRSSNQDNLWRPWSGNIFHTKKNKTLNCLPQFSFIEFLKGRIR